MKEEHKKVEERLKLRHSSNNKFSKTLKRFGGMENEGLKDAFNDMIKEKNALKSRVKSTTQNVHSESSDGDSDDDDLSGSDDLEDELTMKQKAIS